MCIRDRVTGPGTYTATFQWQNGPSAMKIHSVKLYAGNREVAADNHEGWTGVENKDNSYRLDLKKYRTNLDSYIPVSYTHLDVYKRQAQG